VDTKAKITKDKLGFIDALRGIACLSIFIYHLNSKLFSVYIDSPQSLGPFIKFAGYGVALFFIISSFTLYLSLETKKDENNRFMKFYIRRLFRIAPLFYTMLIVFLIKDLIALQKLPSALEILMNILFIFNLSSTYYQSIVTAGWTIGVEMLFYLWLPLIFVVVNSWRRSLAFVGAAILLYGLTKMLFSGIFLDEFINYKTMNFLSQLPVFAIGIVCYFAYKYYIPKVRDVYRIPSSLLLLALSFCIFYAVVTSKISYIIPQELGITRHWWEALAFSLLFLSLSLYSNGLIVNRATRFYGKISYSFYLVHPLLLEALIPAYLYIAHSTLPLMVALCLCLLLSILVATPIAMLTYRLIESPGMRYGKQIIARL